MPQGRSADNRRGGQMDDPLVRGESSLRTSEVCMAHSIAQRAQQKGPSSAGFAPSVLTLTRDMRIDSVDQGFLNLTGYQADDVLRKPLAAFVGVRQGTSTPVSLSGFLLSEAGSPASLDLHAKDGARVHVMLQKLTLAGDEPGGRTLVLVHPGSKEIQDVLSRNALRLTQDQFVSNVSHEMRTPLSGIVGMADLLKDTELTPSQQEFVSAIQACSKELTALINDVLDYAQLDAHTQSVDRDRFDLPHLLHETVAALTPKDRKRMEMHVQIDPALPRYVIGDASKLNQVLHHLVGNAVKFTRRGEVRTRVTLYETADKNPHVLMLMFSIRDTGAGIHASKKDLVFEPFQQQDTSLTRPYRGAGLGLTLSKQLVELMGGEIWLESDPGWGTEVFFTVPVTPDTRQIQLSDKLLLDTDRTLRDSKDVPPPPVLLRVLLGDGNLDRSSELRLLHDLDCAVTAVTGAVEFMKAWDTGAFDVLVLTDSLKELSPTWVAETIRELETKRGEATPMLSISANADPGIFDAVLHPPYEKLDLEHVLAELLTPKAA